MSNRSDNGLKGFPCDVAIPVHARVKLAAGKLVLAVLADENAIGTADREAFAGITGQQIPVRLTSKEGTSIMIANAALAEGAIAYSAAAGKVGVSAAGAFKVGVVITASAADDDWLEILERPGEVAVP